MGEFMLMLYDDDSSYASEQLLEMVRKIYMKWGPWQAFKYILKQGIMDQRWTLFAIAYNRWDQCDDFVYSERLFGGQVLRRELDKKYLPNDVSKLRWSNRTDGTAGAINLDILV